MKSLKFFRYFARTAFAAPIFIWVILLVLALHSHAPSASAGSRLFEELKGEYLLLRNRDPLVDNPRRWTALAERMRIASARQLRSVAEQEQTLFMVATLYTELVRKGQMLGVGSQANTSQANTSNGDAIKALIILRDLAGRGGEYADDSLARAIELYTILDQPAAVAKVARELRARFSDSEFTAMVADGTTSAPLGSAINQGKGGQGKSSTKGELSAARVVDVVLDPGHGGDDLGAQGYAGLLEKDVTLSIALNAKSILESNGFSVGLTRTNDQFLPLSTRTKIANHRSAKVFVSIHANASVSGTQQGVETYILDGDQSGNTKLLVERENGSEASDLAFLLSDVIQREKNPEAQRLASYVQKNVLRGLRAAGFAATDLGVKRAPFFVLVGSHMPSALIEVGFIDHPEEGKLIGQERYRKVVGSAIAEGISTFLNAQSSSLGSSSKGAR